MIYPADRSLDFTFCQGIYQYLGVAFGNGVYVSCATTGLTRSTDGQTWTRVAENQPMQMNYVRFLNGQFVVMGLGNLLTSSDGLVWTPVLTTLPPINIYDMTFANALYVAGTGRGVWTSPDLIRWTEAAGDPKTNQAIINGVTYGAGRYYACDARSPILYGSTDAQTWTAIAASAVTATFGQFNKIEFLNNGFIAVGQNNNNSNALIVTSPDGVTWSVVNTTALLHLPAYNVAYGGGVYVVVGGSGMVMSSPDAQTWTRSSALGYLDRHGVVFANAAFTAVGDGGVIRQSSDGHRWSTVASSPAATNFYGVARNGSTLVGICTGSSGSDFAISTDDGTTWTTVPTALNQWVDQLVFAAGLFVGISYDGNGSKNAVIVTSPDGVVWTTQATGPAPYSLGIAFYGSRFLALFLDSSNITHGMTSVDGIIWTTVTTFPTSISNAKVGSGGYYYGLVLFAGRNGFTFLTNKSWIQTADLVTYSTQTFANYVTSGWFDGTRTVLSLQQNWIGPPGTISIEYSADEAAWSAATVPSTMHRVTLWDSNGSLIVGGSLTAAGIVVSADHGVTWTAPVPGSLQDDSYPESFFAGAPFWTGSRWLLVMREAAQPLLTSSDALTWAPQFRTGTPVLAYGGGTYVALLSNCDDNQSNDTICCETSADLSTWTAPTLVASGGVAAMVFANNLFVAVGPCGLVLTSANGTAWAAQIVTANAVAPNFADLLYGNGLFVAAGGTSSHAHIATSPDGTTWTVLADPAGSTTAFTKVLFGNGVFVAYDGSVNCYTSTDAVTWTQQVCLPTGSYYGMTLAFNGALFIATAIASVFGPPSLLMQASADGVSWSAASVQTDGLTAGYALDQIVAAQNLLVSLHPSAYTSTISTSETGAFWESWTPYDGFIATNTATHIHAINGRVFVTGNQGMMLLGRR